LVLGFVGIAESTYYEVVRRMERTSSASESSGDEKKSRESNVGRPLPGYSLTFDGDKIPDEQIKEWLCDLVCEDGFPYGYRKLTACLREEHCLAINHKKVYRLCKELNILKPQRKLKDKHPRRLARRDVISTPNQLWEMDLKYGYITRTNQFFFQLSLIDVFDRCVIDYHLGLSCTAQDACRILKNSLEKRKIYKGIKMPKVRTDNGPQFIAKKFEQLCKDLGITHERIPVKTPNMNAHIESFHSILEDDCYGRHEFDSFMDVYSVVTEYMRYYNSRRRHGSLNYMAPERFHAAFMNNTVTVKPFAA
jgi:putative transposase